MRREAKNTIKKIRHNRKNVGKIQMEKSDYPDRADNQQKNILITEDIKHPLWISVSEAAKLGGIQTKTVRRAIKSNLVKYKIIGNRYLLDFKSLIVYLYAKTKLKNKFTKLGLGQYIKEWKK